MPESEMDEWAAAHGQPLNAIKIHLLTGHAHRRLKEFDIVIERMVHRKDGTKERVYYTQSWFESEYTFFDPPLVLQRGDRIRYTCRYTNPDDKWVKFGETVEDETCNVFGAYSPSLGGNLLNGSVLKLRPTVER